MNWAGRVTSVWIKGGASSRGIIERQWPELAEALDMLMITEHLRAPDTSGINVEAGLREVLESAGVPEEEIRRAIGCDGCRLIKRKQAALNPYDEDAHYQFQRAARQHRKECPNR